MPDFVARMDSSGTYRPIVEVVVRTGRVRRRLKALVDSGADRSIIPAELLGDLVTFEELPSAGTAGGLGAVELRSADSSLSFAGTIFATSLLVTAPGTHLRYAVLGRDDFFKRFEICFRWTHRPPTFSIEPAA